MIRGTTPVHVFTLPFPAEQMDACYITYTQNGKTCFEKSLEDCKCEENTVSVKLTQEETMLLKSGTMTEIQLAVRVGLDVQRSNIITVDTKRILKEAVI